MSQSLVRRIPSFHVLLEPHMGQVGTSFVIVGPQGVRNTRIISPGLILSFHLTSHGTVIRPSDDNLAKNSSILRLQLFVDCISNLKNLPCSSLRCCLTSTGIWMRFSDCNNARNCMLSCRRNFCHLLRSFLDVVQRWTTFLYG